MTTSLGLVLGVEAELAAPAGVDPCEELSRAALEKGLTIATAESLTAGAIASRLGRASSSGEWYCGGVVAYSKAVKHSVLHVPLGPVVCEDAARVMVQTVATMMGSNLAVAVTGEAGPEPQEDAPVGTVWFGICDHGAVTTEQHHFDGDPGDIVDATVEKAVGLLLSHARAVPRP
jgi:nicotinamide-nucleotide amidase